MMWTLGWLALAIAGMALGLFGNRLRAWAEPPGSERHQFRQAMHVAALGMYVIAALHLPFLVSVIIIVMTLAAHMLLRRAGG